VAIRKFSASSLTNPNSKSSKLWDQETTLGTFESIAAITADASGTSAFTFTNIPQNYTNLQIRLTAKTNRATYAHDDYGIKVGNGTLDSGNNYSCHKIQSEYVSGYSNVYTAGAADTTMYFIGSAISTAGNGAFGVGIIDILDYANTNKYKTIRSLSGGDSNGAVSGYLPNIVFGSGSWRNTAAIDTISVYPSGGGSNWVQYSTACLYGIRGA
jgi:hypothetical protein